VDSGEARYPVVGWVTGTVVTIALAVAVRLLAAILDVEVLVPDRSGGEPVPLALGPVVVVTLGAFVLAAVTVLVLDRVLGDRSRRVARWLGLLVLALSFAPVLLADLPNGSVVVLAVLHVLVALGVLRTVVRGG
jgi:hypothetical protein